MATGGPVPKLVIMGSFSSKGIMEGVVVEDLAFFFIPQTSQL